MSRGKLTQYTVRVYSQHSGIDTWMNISADLNSCLVPFCADCEVTVWSHNSKGASPPARVPTHHGKGSKFTFVAFFHPVKKTNYYEVILESLCVFEWYSPASMNSHPTGDLQLEFETLSNHSVSISWRKYETATHQAGFVVEWYPEGHKPDELSWVRLGRNDSSAVLEGGKRESQWRHLCQCDE